MAVIRIVVNDPFGITLVEGSPSSTVRKIKIAVSMENPRGGMECEEMCEKLLGEKWLKIYGRDNGDNEEILFVKDNV